MINGIELLKKIKNNELKLNQKINVYYDNKDVSYDLVAILTYKGNEVIWSENTFRFSMLYDDNYLFEIIEDKSIIEKIDLKQVIRDSCITMSAANVIIQNKINEIIEKLNKLTNSR